MLLEPSKLQSWKGHTSTVACGMNEGKPFLRPLLHFDGGMCSLGYEGVETEQTVDTMVQSGQLRVSAQSPVQLQSPDNCKTEQLPEAAWKPGPYATSDIKHSNHV